MYYKIKRLFVSLMTGLGLCLGLLSLLVILDSNITATYASGLRYVSKSIEAYDGLGNDCLNDKAPCRSIQYAVDQANSGDTIRVLSGIYKGVSTRYGLTQLVHITKSLKIQGSYKDPHSVGPSTQNPTILDAEGQGRGIVISGSGIIVTLEGLHITGGNAAGQRGTLSEPLTDVGGGVYVFQSTVHMKSCVVYSNTAGNDPTATDSSGGGVYAGFAHNSTFEYNTIFNNSARRTAGIIIAASNDVHLIGNLVKNNSGGGVGVVFGTAILDNLVVIDNQTTIQSPGLTLGSVNAIVRHNTIARNSGGDGSGVHITDEFDTPPFLGISNIQMDNSIIAEQTLGITVSTGSTVTVDSVLWHNITNLTGGPGTTVISNQLTADPKFKNDGYHILLTSGAYSASIDTDLNRDVDGNYRPYGGPELGADELVTSLADPNIKNQLYFTDIQTFVFVEIPFGALLRKTLFQYTRIEGVIGSANASEINLATSEPSFSNLAFDLEAYQDDELVPNFVFSAPVTMTITYSEAVVTDLDEPSLVLARWDSGIWRDAATTCDPTSTYTRQPGENWLSVSICELGRFALVQYPFVYLPVILRND